MDDFQILLVSVYIQYRVSVIWENPTGLFTPASTQLGLLTHFKPMLRFVTPENTRKPRSQEWVK